MKTKSFILNWTLNIKLYISQELPARAVMQEVSWSRQLAVSLFGNMIGKMGNTYEHQRVSDGKIQICNYSDTETRALST